MKVLAISSSPRKGGNSDVLCDEFLRGAAENGHETRKIRLAEKKNRAVRGLAAPARKVTSASVATIWRKCLTRLRRRMLSF